MSTQSYEAAFFIVPSRILQLPYLQFSHLKVYESIFQFWNRGKTCYLSNKTLMERTGIASESTIKDALVFFESHNELIRRTINGKRYLVQPERMIEEISVDKSENDCTNNDRAAAPAAPPSRHSGPPPAATAAHKINKVNIKNINKNSCSANAERFNDFWNVYPKKEAKDDALKAWKKLKLDEKADLIITAIIKRIEIDQSWRGSKQFIPLPASYLNSKRWEDEISTNTIEKPVQIAKPNEPRSTVKEYGPGHELWEAKQKWEREHGQQTHGSVSATDQPRGNCLRKAETFIL